MKVSYEEIYKGFFDRGFILDTSKEEILKMTKQSDRVDCHCIKHMLPKNTSWANMKAGRASCSACRKENGRRDYTDEEKIKILQNHGFKYISGDLTKILNPVSIECEQGHIFARSVNNIMRGEDKCPFCNGTVPMGYWNKETCQKWIDKNNINYIILDIKKEDSQLFIYVHCGNDEHEPYWCSWGHFKNGTRCNKCYYENNNRTFWTLENAKELLSKYGYKIIDENAYVSSHERVDCIDELGFKYPVSIHFITQGRRKFSLWRNNKYALDNIKRFCELYRPDYEFISEEYLGNKVKHRWRYIGDCLPDGAEKEFDLVFGHFVSCNCGHPELNRSKLEARCKSILDTYNIKYEMQKTFEGCAYRNKLRFDFYLELNNKRYCIETDGNQHYVPIDRYGGLEGLILTQKRDKIKNEYCLNNNIILIRIKEKDFKNMENILIKELELYQEELAS